MTTLGDPGAALLIVPENLFPPLSSEMIFPPAGSSVDTDTSGMIILIVILWYTFDSVAGARALYEVGVWLGPDRTCRILARVPSVKTSDIDRTETFPHRRGGWTVFTGHMVPVSRSLISIPAGVIHMNPLWFTLLTTAGVAVWSTILVSAGYALGANWSVVEDYVGISSKVVIAACVVALAWFIAVRLYASWRVTTD